MTTEQFVLVNSSRRSKPLGARLRAALLMVAWRSAPCAGMFIAVALSGCVSSTEKFRYPAPLVSPYDARQGDVLWAVAPLRNETGVSVVNTPAVADALVATIQETRGLSAVPLNRTLAAMVALGMTEVASVEDAHRLAAAMGVDAILVGSVTAWHPYEPPRLGMSLALLARLGGDRLIEPGGTDASGLPLGRTGAPLDMFDPRSLASSPTEPSFPPTRSRSGPLSTAAAHLDGSNHEVLIALRGYAEGRNDPDSALGWRWYLASMTLFTRFACHQLTEDLLNHERLRLAQERVQRQAVAR